MLLPHDKILAIFALQEVIDHKSTMAKLSAKDQQSINSLMNRFDTKTQIVCELRPQSSVSYY